MFRQNVKSVYVSTQSIRTRFSNFGATGGVPLSTVPTPMFAIKRSFGSIDVFQNYWKSEIITMISFRLFFLCAQSFFPTFLMSFLLINVPAKLGCKTYKTYKTQKKYKAYSSTCTKRTRDPQEKSKKTGTQVGLPAMLALAVRRRGVVDNL